MSGSKYAILRCLKALNVLLMTMPFATAWMAYYGQRTAVPYYARGHCAVIVVFMVLYIFFGRNYEGFLISYSRVSQIVYSQGLAVFFSDMVMYLVTWLLSKRFPNILSLLAAFVAQIGLSYLWSMAAQRWYFSVHPPKRTAGIHGLRDGIGSLIHDYGFERKFDVQLEMDVEECLRDLSVLDGMEVVFLSGVRSHERNMILKHCVARGVTAMVLPRIGDVLMSGAVKMHLFHLPMLRVVCYNPPVEYLFLKRLCDVVLSALGLVVLSPLMLVTAATVKFTDGGPVFYRQTRLTKDRREFELFKFRSMRVDAEKDGIARLSSGSQDDRVTRVGRIIRACRVDELPQLFNVLKGEMSLVGPRPERPEIAVRYEEVMPEFRLRLQAKAGLTGYAQVYGKYNTTPYDKLQMDLMYIAHPSLVEDLSIILATVKILFTPESTEGVKAVKADVTESWGGIKYGRA